jgi:hypothetical protein
VFALASRRTASLVPWVAASASFLVLAGVREYLFPALPATALALLSMLALRYALSQSAAASVRGGAGLWIAPGIAAACALLFRHDFGACALLACLWGWFRAFRAPSAGRQSGRALAALLAGFALVAVPPLLALLATVPGTNLYENLIGIPLRVYVEQRGLPFPLPGAAWEQALSQRSPVPMLSLLGVWLPPVAALLATLLVVQRARGSAMRNEQAGTPALVFESLLVLEVLLCLKGSVRVQVVHMLPALMVSLVLLAVMIDGAKWHLPGRLRLGLVGLALLAVVGASAQRARAWTVEPSAGPLALRLANWRLCLDKRASPLGCFVVSPEHVAVLAFLREQARPGDTMYVGAGRHDKLFVNDVDLYFLSGLPAATRWHDLHPGVQTTRPVQVEMIGEMTRRPPAFVVLDTAWDDWSEPNASRLSSGVTLLDEYLRARYVLAYASGTLTVSVPRLGATR